MTMFLVGGGPADTLDAVHDQFVAAAKKRGTRVAVAMLGSVDEVGELLSGYADPIRSRWPEAEIVPIWLDDDSDDDQDTTEWPPDLADMAALVVAGGWTPGYLEALRPKRDLIATMVRRGTPYLGFSAGAMVVGKRAIAGGARFRGRQMVPEVWGEGLDELELRDGLALIGPAVDVHCDVSSLGRAMAVLEHGEVTSVVAIDEGTCLVVDPVSGRTTVEGSQRIHWLSRDGKQVVVQHESSGAELERHEGFLAAERKAAEERAEAERRAAEQAEAEQAARQAEQDQRAAEQAAREAEEQAQREAVAREAGVAPEQLAEAVGEQAAPAQVVAEVPAPGEPQVTDPTQPWAPQIEPASQPPQLDPPQGEDERSSAVDAAVRAADEAAALEGEPLPDEFGRLDPDAGGAPRA